MILIGVNDITHSVLPATSVRNLAEAVRRLREAGVEVAGRHLPRPRHGPADPAAAQAGRPGLVAAAGRGPVHRRASSRAAAPSRSARSSARSSTRRPRCCSAPTASTPRPTATGRWPTCCCRRRWPRSGSARRPSSVPRRSGARGCGRSPHAAIEAARHAGHRARRHRGRRRTARRTRSLGRAAAPPPPPDHGRPRPPTRPRTPRPRRPRHDETAPPGVGRAVRRGLRSVRAEDRQDAQQVGVDPDQADGQRERGTPRLALRDARRRRPARRSRSRGSA